ncbi:exonuclease 3'-5' domain-containing protein 2-like [Sycon ciliatum]|uniref:exonuclease 3'-5' domain-containing protein 2-like n=1 Tax=Sycon ciliatum TaxID=27933 RepID=UPI0031F6D3B0
MSFLLRRSASLTHPCPSPQMSIVSCYQRYCHHLVAKVTSTMPRKPVATAATVARRGYGCGARRDHSRRRRENTVCSSGSTSAALQFARASSQSTMNSLDEEGLASVESRMEQNRKIINDIAQGVETEFRESVSQMVLPTVKKNWASKSIGKMPSGKVTFKAGKVAPDLQHLPPYEKPGLQTILTNNAKDLEAAIDKHFLPRLLPFCPPEVRDKEDVTSEDILKVLDMAEEPLMSGLDGDGKYRACVCGLDTEGRYIVLIQLSMGDCAILYRSWALCKFPENFKRLLRSKGLVKLGVGVVEDGQAILKQHQQVVAGCVDLRNLAHVVSVCCQTTIHGMSLRMLAGQFAEARLSKTYQVSDWGRTTLSDGQVSYAARDATIAEDIFNKMKGSLDGAGLTAVQLVRLFKQFSDSKQLVSFSRNQAVSMSEPISPDEAVRLSEELSAEDQRAKSGAATADGSKPPAQTKRELGKEVDAVCASMEQQQRRKKPMYSNCRLVDRNGHFLAMVDESRSKWYLNKKLAEIVSESPDSCVTLKLKFDTPVPNCLRTHSDEPRKNICAVCGSTEIHAVLAVIPNLYRRNFPLRLRAHFSHDKVLMCESCSSQYNFAAHRLSDYYDIRYGLSVGTTRSSINSAIVTAKSVRSAARGLVLHNKGQFPESTVQSLTRTIAEFYKIADSEVTEEVLKKAMDIDMTEFSTSSAEHGRLVVEKVKESDPEYGYERFIMEWRQYFLDIMQPKQLPSFWSVTFQLDERLGMADDDNWSPRQFGGDLSDGSDVE